jgi:hypothetical protein
MPMHCACSAGALSQARSGGPTQMEILNHQAKELVQQHEMAGAMLRSIAFMPNSGRKFARQPRRSRCHCERARIATAF